MQGRTIGCECSEKRRRKLSPNPTSFFYSVGTLHWIIIWGQTESFGLPAIIKSFNAVIEWDGYRSRTKETGEIGSHFPVHTDLDKWKPANKLASIISTINNHIIMHSKLIIITYILLAPLLNIASKWNSLKHLQPQHSCNTHPQGKIPLLNLETSWINLH